MRSGNDRQGNVVNITVGLPSPPSTPPRPRASDASQSRRADETAASSASPAITPRRKPPRCRHCNNLRKGHPASGCPFVDPPIPPNRSARSRASTPVINIQQINNHVEVNHFYGLGDSDSIMLASPPRTPDRRTRSRPQTPHSPPTDELSDGSNGRPAHTTNEKDSDGDDYLQRLQQRHPSTVYAISLDEDELKVEALLARRYGWAARILLPEDSPSAAPKGILLVSKDPIELSRHYNRLRRDVNDTPVHDILVQDFLRSLAIILRIFEYIMTALVARDAVGRTRPG